MRGPKRSGSRVSAVICDHIVRSRSPSEDEKNRGSADATEEEMTRKEIGREIEGALGDWFWSEMELEREALLPLLT